MKQDAFNQEQTKRVGQLPMYVRYKEWLISKGVKMDSRLIYPAYFGAAGRGVIGVTTTVPIQQKRALIAIPQSLIITADRAWADPALKAVIMEQPRMFVRGRDAAVHTLLLYVSRELVRGQESEYYYYWGVADQRQMEWSGQLVTKTMQSEVVRQLQRQKGENERKFMEFLRIYVRHEELFPRRSNGEFKELFERAYSFVCTRAFGWSLPAVSLIPLADSFNHHNSNYLNHFLVNVQYEKERVGEYRCKGKRSNLAVLGVEGGVGVGVRREDRRRKVKFVNKHSGILENMGERSITERHMRILFEQYKAEIHSLKTLHFLDSSCSEDNDTEEEEVFEREHRREELLLHDQVRVLTPANRKGEVERVRRFYVQQEGGQQEQEQGQKHQISLESKLLLRQQLLGHNDKSSSPSATSSQSEQEQDLGWVAGADQTKTYFVMQTRWYTPPHKQIYNFYGRRSNSFLLREYRFVLPHNKYDSYPLRINLGFAQAVPPHKLIHRKGDCHSRVILLKEQRISVDLINICRMLTIRWWGEKCPATCILRGSSLEVEVSALEKYAEIMKAIVRGYVSEDEEELQGEEQTVLQLRVGHKRIIQAQLKMVALCQEMVRRGKKIQFKEMEDVGRIRKYLKTVDRMNII